MIKYNQQTLNKMARLLWDDQYERVACLVGKKDGDDYMIFDVIPARNEDYYPSEEFFISGNQMERIALEAERKGYVILGVAHSHLPHHPSVPSEADITYCKHAVNAVYHPSTERLTWFNSKGELSRERLQTPWEVNTARPALAFI